MQFALLVLHTIVSIATCTTLLALGLRFGHTATTSRLHLRGDALPCDEAATDVPRVSTAQTTHVSLSPSTTASTGTTSPFARISADEPSVADENADTLNLDLVVLPAETAAPAPGATFRHGSCLAAVVFIVAALMLL
ncbi:hypothetical protein E4U09_001433 [Claviceps aff. purpurea]|uniref:Uncharacterized protein n=1 Tax=Claviceps aff. purpurea TaxID=1967640 RepID=A0A9P7QHJ4_9HYPO|nr:hypothetical protein E4U09_001433 [Claviceps aff. purpurea]